MTDPLTPTLLDELEQRRMLADELSDAIDHFEHEDVVSPMLADALLAVGEMVVGHKDTILSALRDQSGEVEKLREALKPLATLKATRAIGVYSVRRSDIERARTLLGITPNVP